MFPDKYNSKYVHHCCDFHDHENYLAVLSLQEYKNHQHGDHHREHDHQHDDHMMMMITWQGCQCKKGCYEQEAGEPHNYHHPTLPPLHHRHCSTLPPYRHHHHCHWHHLHLIIPRHNCQTSKIRLQHC